jgi:prepilin-type N-terminal cleavage/methylation domain-containing protein
MGTRQSRHQLARHASRRARNAGFTFIEVMVSLALLAASVSILIGMESAAVRRTLRDMNEQQAILAGRRVMAFLETAPSSALTFSSQADMPLSELFTQLNIESPADQDNKEVLGRMRASIDVQEQQIPLRNGTIGDMVLINLSLAWGMSQLDQTSISYLRPK